jgi:DNA-directed RNA polymerase specialized sigma subunit
MLCNECPKRDKCKTLCKEVEEYISKDYRFSKEIPLSELDLEEDVLPTSQESVWNTNGVDYWDLEAVKIKYNLTDRQFDILYKYFIDGMSQSEIAEELHIDQSNVSRFIYKLAHKFPNK